ncbi:MAG: InlB B-repeat-containing protein, partial [Clostridia bacterium]
FFADWSATNYELTFHTASTQRPGKKIFSIESVAQIVLPTLDAETANKRSFVGWSFVENDRNNVITSFDPNSYLRNVDLFAVWKGDDVTITTIVDGASSDTIVEFGAIFYIKPPTKAGFSFDGWFDQQVDGTRLSKVSGESLAIVGDNSAKTIYARWVKNVNLTFDALGGKNLSISIRPGANVIYETTTRYKYDTFVGWRCNGVTYTSDFVAPTQDATFVAVWETEYKYISNAQELWAIDADLNTKTDGKYMLTRDIDLSAYNWYGIGNRGSSFKIFTGILDGDGHKIVGFHSGVILQRNDGNSGYWGLFVYTRWATFTDLTLENVSIGLGKDGDNNAFSYYLGALCGVAN